MNQMNVYKNLLQVNEGLIYRLPLDQLASPSVYIGKTISSTLKLYTDNNGTIISKGFGVKCVSFLYVKLPRNL